jgi:hypothetical protein
VTDETTQPPPCADHGYNRLECPECGDARRVHYEKLAADLEELEAVDPAVAEASARLDETTAAIVAKARFAAGGYIPGPGFHGTERAVDGAPPLPRTWGGASSIDDESTSARLRRVEQDLAEMREARDVARSTNELLRAELASARAELERLRYSGWSVARDAGRTCTACGQEIRRGEAYTTDTTRDVQKHVHCPEGGTA